MAKRTTVKELTEHLQRLQAEFDNYRKRTDAEQEKRKQLLTEHIMRDLLPVLDNFSLALSHGKDATSEELLKGILMVEQHLTTTLADYGLEKIPSTGMFDPQLHEAVQTATDPKKKNNSISKTLQTGYKLGDRILRPSRVSVIKNTEA